MSLTLKDIARMAGVAESTVSRAINNKPGVSKKTKEKILNIVKEYNFKPNQLAQGLAKKKTHILALILSDLTTPGYTEIIKKVEDIANENDYQVILCNTNNDFEREKAYLDLVSKHRVDGAIILGGELADKNILRTALNKEDAIVLVNCLAEEFLIPTVLVDNAMGGYLATKHLLDQGLKRVAIIMGSSDDYLESEKLNGYFQAHQEKGIKVKKEYIIATSGKRKDGYDSFFKITKLSELPQGFFVTRDLLAVGLIEAVKMGAYFIPDDFAVVGYGESVITSIINPPLTVVAEPLEELGRLAAQYLIDLLDNNDLEESIKVLEPVLKVRKSSNPPVK